MSPMSQMLGAGLATAGAVAGAKVVAFGSDGNAPDWQVKGFKQARDVVTVWLSATSPFCSWGAKFLSAGSRRAHLMFSYRSSWSRV